MPKHLLFTILGAMVLFAHVTWAESGSALFSGPYILGSSVYTTRDFAPDIAVHVGQPTSAAVLESLRSAIRSRYTHDGYVTPIVSVPAPDVTSSNPRFVIHEATISAVEIRGNAGPYRSQIDQFARELHGMHPLRKEVVKSTLRRISELPGITSRPLFDQRPDATNDFLLVLRVDYKAVAGKVEVSNGGTRNLGRELLTADLSEYDLLGLQEQISLTGAVSSRPDRYQYEDARLSRRFDNTLVFADVSGSTAVPEFDGHFRDTHFSAGVAQKVRTVGDGGLSLNAAVSADNGSVIGIGGPAYIEDHERNVSLGLTLARSEDLLPSRIYVGAQRGVDALGSRINEGANADVDPRYTKYLMQGEQVYALGRSWNLQFDIDGQVTSAVLPVLQRFTFGGVGFGAAFDPATLSGDSGAEVSAQLAHVFHVIGLRIQSLRVYVRSDTAIAWNNSYYFYHRDEASSAGGGISARWTNVIATLEISTPVEQPRYAAAAQSVRTFGAVAYIF